MARVEAGVVGVVAGDGQAGVPGIEQHVPVHGREATAALDLAARVVDLDAHDCRQTGDDVHRHVRPVGMRDVGDAAVLGHERHRVGQIGVGVVVLRLDVEPAIEAVDEHVDPDARLGTAGELDPGHEHDPVPRRRPGDCPTVGDCERGPLGPLVVVDERLGLELAVGAGGVGVQRTAQPGAVCLERVRHRRGPRESTIATRYDGWTSDPLTPHVSESR